MDRLEQIFCQQRSHMSKYADIEAERGLLQTPDIPVDLDDRFGQARLKDFAWRITEELGEALENVGPSGYLNQAAYFEEIADVLHFLTEMTILAGYEPKQLLSSSAVMPSLEKDESVDLLNLLYTEAIQNIRKEERENPIDSNYIIPFDLGLTLKTGQVVKELALACNKLKNKPWKRTPKPTNFEAFDHHFRKTWLRFIELAHIAGMDETELYNQYFGKSQVNIKRRETNY